MMMDMEKANQINNIIMPDLGNVIGEFYQLLLTNKSDPFTIPGRIYKPMKNKIFMLRTIGGQPLAQSMGQPLTTYEIMKRFQELINSFHEEKGFFGSNYSMARKKVLAELASIKEFAEFASSQILHMFK
jgi:hypothetical protein